MPNERLILCRGKLLRSPQNEIIITESEAPPPTCCCPIDCCNLQPTIFNLVATIESTDCPAIDGATIPLTIADNTTPPTQINCWTGNPDVHNPCILDATSGFYQLYTLCCCTPDTGSNCSPTDLGCDGFCLTIGETDDPECFIFLNSAYPVSCTCDPFELVFTGYIKKVVDPAPIPENCICCVYLDDVTIRIVRA